MLLDLLDYSYKVWITPIEDDHQSKRILVLGVWYKRSSCEDSRNRFASFPKKYKAIPKESVEDICRYDDFELRHIRSHACCICGLRGSSEDWCWYWPLNVRYG
ncbi:uncharacterized protein LOC118206078 [Stegodyphus dumicola]|uniref:uncharacterized protein LOC118206078 n=1 Tax=Stegodyphus dumicola TaxID=202533 RepID=UPI0015AEDBEC|nr:uncharacterized protein LOC118206078 [Stegodyphus dumicola]